MRKSTGFVVSGILLLPILVGVLLLGLGLWLRMSLPEPSGHVASPEIGAEVEVIFDSSAVPHIFADSLTDAYFALGHLHARDRLWQMETQRRVGQGRMSEILGTLTLDLDRTLRALDLYRSARRSFEQLPPVVRNALNAYSAGVNHYLRQPAAPLPLEFQLTFHRPEPWHPADTLVWFKTMALVLGRDYRSELLRARLLSVVEPERLEELFSMKVPGDPVTVQQRNWQMPRPWPKPRGPLRPLAAESVAALPGGLNAKLARPPLFDVRGETRASNIWVVAGRHTESGKPILANDPHLALDAPSLWYLARIVTPGLELAGATVPGVPFHLLGQNGRLAWGITATGIDAQDLAVESLPAAENDPESVIRSRRETIDVRFDDPVEQTVRSSPRGPILSDVDPVAAGLVGEDRAMALLATVFTDRDTTAAALHALNRATNVDDAFAAMRGLTGTNLNMVFADSDGEIAYLAAGLVPLRHRGDGWLPQAVEGDEPLWSGFVPFEHLPRTRNPERGWIFSANNAIVDDAYPYFLGYEWESPYRARRVIELLESGTAAEALPYTVEDAMAMQRDTRSLAALELLPILAQVSTNEPDLQQALDLLLGWDGEMLRDRPEPLLFWSWVRALNRLVFADELGTSLYDAYAGFRPEVLARVLGGDGDWCNSTATPRWRERCEELIVDALRSALAAGREQYGTDITRWRWGEVHTAPLQHRLLSRIPLLAQLVDISVETDGGNYTLNRGASYGGAVADGDDDNPFAHVHGAGYRAVYDLARPENSRFVISTGQSGNPLSPHYDDFVERWRDGEYVRIAGSRPELRAGALGVLRFAPEQ